MNKRDFNTFPAHCEAAARAIEMACVKAETEVVGKVQFTTHGRDEIVLPAGMSNSDAIESLAEKEAADRRTIGVHESIRALPLDGAVNFMRALQRVFGWVTPKPKQGFMGENPPVAVSVEVGYEQTFNVFWGSYAVPALKGELSTNVEEIDGRPSFVIGGEVPKAFEAKVKMIADLTRLLCKEDSIYRGTAFRVKTTSRGKLDVNNYPTFLDTSRAEGEELLFSKELERQVQTNLFTPIEYTDACRHHNIPLKRGVLLEGAYGTGKTMTAHVTARKAEENGWTYITIDRVAALAEVLDLAAMYAPAVVFAEDIDRVISGDDRTVSVDDLLNAIDGVSSKGGEIITVLTSNHVERINKAMLRPGRLDAVIHVTAPDADTAARLVHQYARGLMEDSADLTEVGAVLAGKIPAVIREIVERAKLYAINRVGGNADQVLLDSEDLIASAQLMEAHLALLADVGGEAKSPEQVIGEAFLGSIEQRLSNEEGDLSEMIGNTLHQTLNDR